MHLFRDFLRKITHQVSYFNTSMTEIARLITTLKQRFKAAGLSYRDVARALGLSEPSVKRLLGNGRISVERLAQICDLLGLTMAELLQEAEMSVPNVHTLTPEQEARLVSDNKFLLVAVCALNHWSVDDIISVYRLTAAESIKYLLELDRMGIINLKPGNRIRLLVARDFDWLPDGPIRRFFLQNGLPDFMNSGFDAPDASMSFVHGMLTKGALDQLNDELFKLRTKFAALHDQSSSEHLSEKSGTGLVLAMRVWEPEAFKALRRTSVTVVSGKRDEKVRSRRAS
jgi:transcriptional regulator with XRE-family HTH domain